MGGSNFSPCPRPHPSFPLSLDFLELSDFPKGAGGEGGESFQLFISPNTELY